MAATGTTTALNDGLDAAGFDALAEVFDAHCRAGRGGMAFCAYRAGRPLARFYGGRTVRAGDDPAPGLGPAADWGPDTLAVLFSGTKGIVAALAAVLADRGLLDPDAPVAAYWPGFAAAGKGSVTVAHVLSHTAGLLYLDPAPDFDAQTEHERAAAVLAAQPTLWEPGSRVAYHALTYGTLMAETIRRATGSTVGRLVGELLARPLGLDLHLGLPEELDARVATVGRAEGYRISTFLTDPERRRTVDRMYGDALTGDQHPFHSVAMRRAGNAAGGAIGSADAMAKLYSHLADPATSPVSAAALGRATRTWSEGVDAVNDRPLRFGLGFELADPLGTYGPVAPAFGHSGAGGGLHGAWPGKNVGFSFLTNEMVAEDVDTRAKDLLRALSRAV